MPRTCLLEPSLSFCCCWDAIYVLHFSMLLSFSSRDNFFLTVCFFFSLQTVMSNLREEPDESSQMYMSYEPSEQGIDEPMRGMNDTDWDMWEEWMGWEGAGIRDYSSHVNPYI